MLKIRLYYVFFIGIFFAPPKEVCLADPEELLRKVLNHNGSGALPLSELPPGKLVVLPKPLEGPQAFPAHVQSVHITYKIPSKNTLKDPYTPFRATIRRKNYTSSKLCLEILTALQYGADPASVSEAFPGGGIERDCKNWSDDIKYAWNNSHYKLNYSKKVDIYNTEHTIHLHAKDERGEMMVFVFKGRDYQKNVNKLLNYLMTEYDLHQSWFERLFSYCTCGLRVK